MNQQRKEDLCRRYEVLLHLTCNVCWTEATFAARTRREVEAVARAAGWSMPRCFAYCQEHKGVPPSFK